jgi:two-component system chemotaxis sensor kinase CheA
MNNQPNPADKTDWDIDMSQYRDLFIAESRTRLQVLNRGLLTLKSNPADQAVLEQVLCAAHTLKSMAAAMGYGELAQLAHAMEDLLDLLRRGEVRAPAAETISLLLSSVDACTDLLADISEHGSGGNGQAPMLARRGQARAAPAPVVVATPRELLEATPDVLNLGESILHVRLMPVAVLFNRFLPMVHDLLASQGKVARLIVEGGGIELDRTVLDVMADPLVHLLRNAVDHGLEMPDERERLRKPREGTIRLSAQSNGDGFSIEVADDGRGIDLDQVLRTAITRGMVTQAEASRLSEPEVLMLICRSGFSTAPKVTEVSGRGIGMDVVKRQIDALHGSLEIESRPGLGTTISLHLPPTQAILQGLCRSAYQPQ